MKVVTLENYDTGEFISRFKVGKVRDNLFDIDRMFSRLQNTKDILGLGYTCPIVSTGITYYSKKGPVISNGDKSNIKPGYVSLFQDGATILTTLRLKFTIYPEGYIIGVGKKTANIFGTLMDLYIKSIGKISARFAGSMDAHVFPTMKAVLQYLQNHQKDMKYLAKEKGYSFQVTPSCDLFAEDMEHIPPLDQNVLQEVESLLEQINESDGNGTDSDDQALSLNGSATDDEMEAEAVLRLKKLEVISSAIDKFKASRTVYMSDFGGFLYDLNADAKVAIKEVSFNDELPYAVICSHTTIGTMYCVLFVSREKEDWHTERPDKNGYCYAYVYNGTNPVLSEYGDVCVQGANGGIIRLV